MSTSSPDSFRRALDFLRGVEDRAAKRWESFNWGTALFHDDFPIIHDLNFLRVDGAPEDATADALAAEADRILGEADLSHRKVVLEDEALGDRLKPRFQELRWEVGNLLYMEARRESNRPLTSGIAQEVDIDAHLHVRDSSLREDPEFATNEEAIVQMRDCFKVWASTSDTRVFAASVDGEPVSSCELYSDGATAQIEAVLTLEAHRNRGLGVAVVLLALEEAKKAGHDTVFLIAEDDDWPKKMYEKLGFDPIGRTHEFKITDIPKVERPESQ